MTKKITVFSEKKLPEIIVHSNKKNEYDYQVVQKNIPNQDLTSYNLGLSKQELREKTLESNPSNFYHLKFPEGFDPTTAPLEANRHTIVIPEGTVLYKTTPENINEIVLWAEHIKFRNAYLNYNLGGNFSPSSLNQDNLLLTGVVGNNNNALIDPTTKTLKMEKIQTIFLDQDDFTKNQGILEKLVNKLNEMGLEKYSSSSEVSKIRKEKLNELSNNVNFEETKNQMNQVFDVDSGFVNNIVQKFAEGLDIKNVEILKSFQDIAFTNSVLGFSTLYIFLQMKCGPSSDIIKLYTTLSIDINLHKFLNKVVEQIVTNNTPVGRETITQFNTYNKKSMNEYMLRLFGDGGKISGITIFFIATQNNFNESLILSPAEHDKIVEWFKKCTTKDFSIIEKELVRYNNLAQKFLPSRFYEKLIAPSMKDALSVAKELSQIQIKVTSIEMKKK